MKRITVKSPSLRARLRPSFRLGESSSSERGASAPEGGPMGRRQSPLPTGPGPDRGRGRQAFSKGETNISSLWPLARGGNKGDFVNCRSSINTTATDHQEPHPHPNPPPEREGILWVFPTFMGVSPIPPLSRGRELLCSFPFKGEVRRGMG